MKKDGNFVLRKSAYLLSAAACCTLLLVSCGGGGSSTPTPSPSPTPVATSTATPTPTTYTLDFAHDFSMSSPFMYISAYFTPSGGAETFSDASRKNTVGGISYTASPEDVQFAYPDLSTPAEFTSADLTGSTATERDYINATGEKLTLEVPYGNVLRATYERTDPYTDNTVAGTLRSDRVGLFLNYVTTTSAIASTLSYTGETKLVGGTPGTTPAGAVTAPTATFQVDTGGNLTGTIPIMLNSGGTPTTEATLDFSATVDTATGGFTGTLSDSTNGFDGNFAGALAGPNRQELVIVFAVSNTDGRKYIGSYIGH